MGNVIKMSSFCYRTDQQGEGQRVVLDYGQAIRRAMVLQRQNENPFAGNEPFLEMRKGYCGKVLGQVGK